MFIVFNTLYFNLNTHFKERFWVLAVSLILDIRRGSDYFAPMALDFPPRHWPCLCRHCYIHNFIDTL